MHMRIAANLAKPVPQVAERIRVGQLSRRTRLSRGAFRRYIQKQTEPVEWIMEACAMARCGAIG